MTGGRLWNAPVSSWNTPAPPQDVCVTAAGLVGGRALMVNAVDEDAAAFWRRCGFTPSRDEPLILFRSIAAIAASLEQARG